VVLGFFAPDAPSSFHAQTALAHLTNENSRGVALATDLHGQRKITRFSSHFSSSSSVPE
jgi:hypothetical protein